MPTESDNTIAQIRVVIEQRVNEQLERQRKVSPNIDPRTVVDMQIQQEKERLEKKLDAEESPAMAEAFKALLAWLPELARELKGR